MNFRLLLLPFSFFYWLVIVIRNWCFDFGIFKVTTFQFPVVAVGNISTGGTGKTPHIVYLANLLSKNKNVAVLSRGYGRNTKGFLYVSENSSVESAGDEPLQLKNKFKKIVVAVCEKRKTGIEKIKKDNPNTSVILMDDAFQHRQVKPGLMILLLNYSGFRKHDFLLPAGNLREPFSAKKRADVIIVSKCPENMTEKERENIISEIAPEINQKLFFSRISYDKLQAVFANSINVPDGKVSCLLVTGIADSSEIKKYCELNTNLINHLEFADHHRFTDTDVRNIMKIFSTIAAENKIIITTEKDAMRMKEYEILKNFPLFYLPVKVKFLNNDEQNFNQLIQHYVG